MACVANVVAKVDSHAYAHHIERLMVLGNLCLLAGVAPQQLVDWMWEQFIDGAEWVMQPNVVGMSLHADGGRMATKPYAAGGAYLSRMSDHCKGCRYNPKLRTGPDACPFTTLYWDFIARHEERFAPNHRMGNQLGTMRRLKDLPEVRARAQEVLTLLDSGHPEPVGSRRAAQRDKDLDRPFGDLNWAPADDHAAGAVSLCGNCRPGPS
jgi:deoxyribodipyrimidine photolyase-related protein